MGPTQTTREPPIAAACLRHVKMKLNLQILEAANVACRYQMLKQRIFFPFDVQLRQGDVVRKMLLEKARGIEQANLDRFADRKRPRTVAIAIKERFSIFVRQRGFDQCYARIACIPVPYRFCKARYRFEHSDAYTVLGY